VPGDAEPVGNGREIGPPEHRAVIRKAVGAQLVDFRAIGPVIDGEDDHPQPVAADRLKFLNMHQQAAVAVEQHHWLLRPCRGHPHGKADAVADGAEFANGQEMRLRPRRHMRKEAGTVT